MGAALVALYITMSAIKDGRLVINLDKERHLLFSLNALDEVQDRFGGIDKLGDAMAGNGAIKNIRWLLTLLLNEGSEDTEEELTEKQVGRMIHTGNFLEIQQAIFKAFSLGNSGVAEATNADQEEEEEEENTEKNSQSGQVK